MGDWEVEEISRNCWKIRCTSFTDLQAARQANAGRHPGTQIGIDTHENWHTGHTEVSTQPYRQTNTQVGWQR